MCEHRNTRIIRGLALVGILALLIMPMLVPLPVHASETATVLSTKDTYIDEYYWANTYGDSYHIEVGSQYAVKRGLVHFDLPLLPAGAEITSATLRLYYSGRVGEPAGAVIRVDKLRPIRDDWSETYANWVQYVAGSLPGAGWYTEGCDSSTYDYDPAGYATATVPSSFGWMDWDVTTIIDYAYGQDYTEQGFRLRAHNESNSYRVQWWAKDYGSLVPRLVVTYDLAPDPIVIPTVETAGVWYGETSATLSGLLTADGGESCSTRFQYGLSTSYTHSTSWAAGYTTGQTFSRGITGLSPGTLYYYRAQASNSAGTGPGTAKSFATRPYAPTSFTATAGDTEVELTWTKGTGATNTVIRRSTSSYPTSPTSGTSVYSGTGVSKTDTGLVNGTTYYYSAWSLANSVYSSTKVTDSATPSAPAAPTCTTNAATNVDTTAARLNMHLDSLGGAASANVSFEYYKEGAAEWSSETSTTTYYAPDAHYVDLAGLDAASTYYFRAKGVSAHGTGYGGAMSFVTGGYSAPTMTTQAATGVMRTAATLNGKVADDGGDSVTAWFQYGLSSDNLNMETESISGLLTDDTFYYGLSGLTADTTYYFRCVGDSAEGGMAYGGVLDFTTTTAPAPTVRTDTAVPGANQATLRGTLLTDGGASCDVRFQYGLTDSYGTNTTWLPYYQAVTAFEQLIIGLDMDTTYHYRAQAQNEGGIASGADATFLTVFAAPGDFRATAISSTTINLGWIPGGDMTLVRYSEGTYPVDRTDGTLAYFGTGSTASVSSLDAGASYYFRAWSWREGDVWSESYAEDIATTLTITAPDEDLPEHVTTPDTPSRWFAMPTGEALVNMPFYDQVVGIADSLEIPHGTWWFGFGVLLMVVAGALTWKWTRKAVIAIIVAGVVVAVSAMLTIMPLWFLLMYAALGGGITYVSQRI